MGDFKSSRGTLSDIVVEPTVIDPDTEDGFVPGVVDLDGEEEKRLLWKIDLQYVFDQDWRGCSRTWSFFAGS